MKRFNLIIMAASSGFCVRLPGCTKWGVILMAVCTVLVVQAQSPQIKPSGSYGQPRNVFLASPNLPADLKRVAVLPLSCERTSSDQLQGCQTLGPVLLEELGKTGRFEVVVIKPEDLQGATGRSSWTGAEILPADFFDFLQRVSGCEAVLFCELTTYHPYVPQAIGWRMKLVDVRTRQILWAADKVFDADQPAVSKDAHRQHPLQWQTIFDLSDTKEVWQMDNSPRQFGQYTAAQVLATLPGRQEIVKVFLPATDVSSGQPLHKQNCQSR